MQHTLKIQFEYALQHINGLKPWELRKNDRNFKVNDIIKFLIISSDEKPTGATYTRTINAIYKNTDHGLKEGYCILSLFNHNKTTAIKMD